RNPASGQKPAFGVRQHRAPQRNPRPSNASHTAQRCDRLGKAESALVIGGAAMITKFVTVYPGHIDLPDMGQDATPANDRNYSNDLLASVFEKTEAVAKTMDRLGYETLWLAEHHFQREGYECLPNILMLAVHLAHVTKRLKVGCGFNITPMWHPL